MSKTKDQCVMCLKHLTSLVAASQWDALHVTFLQVSLSFSYNWFNSISFCHVMQLFHQRSLLACSRASWQATLFCSLYKPAFDANYEILQKVRTKPQAMWTFRKGENNGSNNNTQLKYYFNRVSSFWLYICDVVPIDH